MCVQERRGRSLLGGGATTSAMCEYGMQLSWANRHLEAQKALERPVAEAEAVAAAAAAAAAAGGARLSEGEEPWGARGALDMCGNLIVSKSGRMCMCMCV